MATRTVNSLQRAATLLDALADRSGPGSAVSDLAERTGLPYTTVHRLLLSLVVCGHARPATDPGRPARGSGLVRLGAAARRTYGWWAQPYLERLADLSGETANLATLDGDEVVRVARARSRRSARPVTGTGTRAPAHTTAAGKVLLGYLSSAEVEQLAGRRGLPPRTQFTITTVDRLLAAVDAARADGYATDDEETELGVRCIAVPVLSAANGVAPIAAMSVSGPSRRLTAERCAVLVPRMVRLADQMARES